MSARVNCIATAALSFFLLSCGVGDDLGADIAISVSPTNPLIVEGNGVSCLDAAEVKNTDEIPNASVAPQRVLFTQFRLEWSSPDALKLVALRATLTGPNIPEDSPVRILVDEAELEYLLGMPNLTIESSPTPRIAEFLSDALARKGATTKYVPCGLMLGGLNLNREQGRGTVNIEFELVGYATAADRTQRPVRQTVRAQARFL